MYSVGVDRAYVGPWARPGPARNPKFGSGQGPARPDFGNGPLEGPKIRHSGQNQYDFSYFGMIWISKGSKIP